MSAATQGLASAEIDDLRERIEDLEAELKEANEAYADIVKENEEIKAENEELKQAISRFSDELIDQLKDFDKRNGR